jgi:RNA polymerase sigma factor (sigma-70 family)
MNPGDVEQLTRVIIERAPALVLYARQWLDAAGADDAVQDVCLALVAQRSPPDNPAAWLYRAVRNSAIDQLRANRRRRAREQTVARVQPELFEPRVDAAIDARAAVEWLARLSPGQREVVMLRIWGELGFADIAEVTELAVSTVHDRYRAALRVLRSALEQPCPTKTK